MVNNYKYLSYVVDNIIFGISTPDYPSRTFESKSLRLFCNLVYFVSNRNVSDYIVKSKLRNNSIWGTDTVLKQIILHVELFALALLLRTDIWIYSTEFGNEWMLFSGRGASLIDALTLPVVNTAGSIYLNHNGLHYEPVLGLGKK